MSRTKMCEPLSTGTPGARLSENDANATLDPSALIDGGTERTASKLPCTPALETSARIVRPVCRSRT
jgi:hypothetical protein